LSGVVACIAGAVLINVPALLITGPSLYVDFVAHGIPYIQETAGVYSGNIGMPFAFFWNMRAIFGFHGWDAWQHTIMLGVQMLGVLVLLLFARWKPKNKVDNASICAACVCISLLIAPTVWPHYLVLLVIPALVLARLRTRRGELAAVGLWALLGLVNGRTLSAMPMKQAVQVAAPAGLVLIVLVTTLLLGRFNTDVQNQADSSH
jgi:hypothetical protein